MTGGVFLERELSVVAGGEAASFDRYVSDNRAGLVRYAALLCGSRALGEDLVQEVLIRLYPRWAQLNDPHPYVRRSITNEYLSWRRRWSTRHIQAVGDEFLNQQQVDGLDAWGDGPDPELWARLQRLPRQQRAAVVLRYYEGFDDEEIANLLECKPATVRGHVSRGLASLRISISATGGLGNDG